MYTYSRNLLIWTNLDGEQFGYAENPDNWIFLFLNIGYIGSLKFGCHYLQYVPASRTFQPRLILNSGSYTNGLYLIR